MKSQKRVPLFYTNKKFSEKGANICKNKDLEYSLLPDFPPFAVCFINGNIILFHIFAVLPLRRESCVALDLSKKRKQDLRMVPQGKRFLLTMNIIISAKAA